MYGSLGHSTCYVFLRRFTFTTLAVFKFSGTLPVTMDWLSMCSSGVVISCVVACSSLVDRPSKSSVHLVVRLRTISYISVFVCVYRMHETIYWIVAL